MVAALTVFRFVVANWKWFLIGALVAALGISRFQLKGCRADFAAYKVAAVAEAQRVQKHYDETTREADIIYIQAAPKIITRIKTITKWIDHNVENVSNCPGPDLISVFNASITGNGLPETTSP